MKLGEATTEAEKTAEMAIRQIPDWHDRDLSYFRIQGGITNLNWRIRLEPEGPQFFMKIPGDRTELFIDRALAHEAAVKVANTGFAPRVVHYLPELEIEIHEFLEGFRSSNVNDLLDPVVRRNVTEAYRAIHGTQTLSRSKTGFEQLDERLTQVRQHGGRLPPDLDYLLWQAGRARSAIAAAGMPSCACFNDAYVSNYMIDAARQVRIIDWEYASNNDPHWDLALFSMECFLNGTPAMREIIEIHDGRYSPQAEARIMLYGGVAGLTWALWAALQARISSIPFDFSKYSDLLFLRTRHGMRHPGWEDALDLI